MFRSVIAPRSQRQKREDEEFMQALRSIPTLRVRDGCRSMDASDPQEHIEALREAGRRLTDRQARS